MSENREEPNVRELADAFRRYVEGGEPPAALEDGCRLAEALRPPLDLTESMAVLGAVAAGADFSKCATTAAKYIAFALARMPGAPLALGERLRGLVVKLEEEGYHREAFLVAVVCAVGGRPEILELVKPRSWAEELLYAKAAFSILGVPVDDEVRNSLVDLALRAIRSACSAGPTPCRYAKAVLLPKVAVSLVHERNFDLAEEYIEKALKALEELQRKFDAGEMKEYLDFEFPFGWSEDNVRAVVGGAAVAVYSAAPAVYRVTSSEKMYAYVEELLRRAAGTPYELHARADWARFAYAFRRISLHQLVEEVGRVYADMTKSGLAYLFPYLGSRVAKYYILALAAAGREGDAAGLYGARRGALDPVDRYAVEAYLAAQGIIGGVEGEVKAYAALSLAPRYEHLECVLSGACPPEPILAGRNDTAAALILELAQRGEWEKALEVAEGYADTPDRKEAELWDAVIVALEGRDRESLKRAAFDLLMYIG